MERPGSISSRGGWASPRASTVEVMARTISAASGGIVVQGVAHTAAAPRAQVA